MDPQTELEQRITEAIRYLTPKFEITPEQAVAFRKPTIELVDSIIGDNGQQIISWHYNWKFARFRFPRDYTDNPKMMGHEVGHYLHYELNPSVRIEMEKEGIQSYHFWMGDLLSEVVAIYSELIYATNLRLPFFPNKLLVLPLSGIVARNSEYTHNVGSRKAEKAFQEYGDTLLPIIAKMSIDESMESLPRILPTSFYERRILPLLDLFKK